MATPTGALFNDPRAKPTSTTGQFQAGCYYCFFATGTTTQSPVYADGLLTVVLSQPSPGAVAPVGGTVAASDGRCVPIYLDPSIIYRVQLYNAAGQLLEDTDPYIPPTQSIVYAITAAEKAAGVTPSNLTYPPGDVRRYGAVNDGVTDCTTAFQQAGLSNGLVTVPEGTWKIANVPVSSDNTWFRGAGWDTNLQVGANNATLFNVSGQNCRVSDMMWTGDGTSTSSQNGCGAYLTNAANYMVDRVFWTGFGFGGISGSASVATAGPKILNCKARLTGTLGNEIYLGGIWVDTIIENPDFFSATADRCLLMYDNSTTGWVGVTVRGGGSFGYMKQQWATTDENWDGSLRVQGVLFDGIRCANSNWSAIKCKTSRDVRIVNCKIDNCGIAQEDSVNGLYGDILCNSLGRVIISHNQIRNSGSAAIRCNSPLVSQYPGSNPGGQAINEWTIDHNQIDTVGVHFAGNGYGIYLSAGMKQVIVDSNTMRGITTNGFIALQTSLVPFFDMSYTNNTITDSLTLTGAAVSIAWGNSLRMDNNLNQNFGSVGVQLDNIQEIHIGPSDVVLDAGVTGGYGYQIGNYGDLRFRPRAGNSTYNQWASLTAYTVGQRVFNNTNVYECVIAGTSGNTGGPLTSGANTDGTVTWYFIGRYQLLSYALRLVGSANGQTDADFDPEGVNTAPIAALSNAGAGGTWIRYKQNQLTTNASATNLPVIPLPDTTAWMFKMKALANDSATPNHGCYEIVGLFYRNGAGTVQEGGNTNLVTIESAGAAAWDAKPVVSGNNVAAQVTGAAGKNINWAVEIDLRGMP